MRRVLRHLGLAQYGGDELVLAILACGSAAYALSLACGWLALLPSVPFGIVLWFFRDPERQGTGTPDIFFSPADGTVTDIVEVDEPEFIRGRALRIGIFLSPFNVHVNRVPCDGTVHFIKYKAGEFLPAYNSQAPERNESVSLGLETPAGTRLLVKQITGVLARRIICETHHGEILARGQRYGMIKFGSRTELYIPVSTPVSQIVRVGDKVKGGQTPFIRISEAKMPSVGGVSTNVASAALPVNVYPSFSVQDNCPGPASI